MFSRSSAVFGGVLIVLTASFLGCIAMPRFRRATFSLQLAGKILCTLRVTRLVDKTGPLISSFHQVAVMVAQHSFDPIPVRFCSKVVQLLLEKGANRHKRSGALDETPLELACQRGRSHRGIWVRKFPALQCAKSTAKATRSRK